MSPSQSKADDIEHVKIQYSAELSVHKDPRSSAPAYLLLQALFFCIRFPGSIWARFGVSKSWNKSRSRVGFFFPLSLSLPLHRSIEFISSLIICRCGNKKCAPTKKGTRPFPDTSLNCDAWLLLGVLHLSFSSWKVNRETWQRYEMVRCTFSYSPCS